MRDPVAAFLEYLDMFYNLGLAGRAMRRIGAVEFATTIAPGLRDVLLTGKIREIVTRAEKGKQPVYDAIVVDSPPTGRIARFLDVTKAVSDLAKGGPVHSQAESVVKVLHSDLTAILTFEDLGGKTRYTARVRHWTVADRETHEKMGFHQGWGQCTDQLAALVAKI